MYRAMKHAEQQSAEALYQVARSHAERGEMGDALREARAAEATAHAQLAAGRGDDDLYILWRTVVDEVRTLENRPANDCG